MVNLLSWFATVEKKFLGFYYWRKKFDWRWSMLDSCSSSRFYSMYTVPDFYIYDSHTSILFPFSNFQSYHTSNYIFQIEIQFFSWFISTHLPLLFHPFRLSSSIPVFWYYSPVIPCIIFQFDIPVDQLPILR